jgi:hypothetical protein
MPTATDPERQIAFLRRYGADRTAHSGDLLLAHLLGTRALLRSWEAPPAICDAGLFHSVYGTQSFTGGLVPMLFRPVVRDLIGEEAEALAYLFGIMEASIFLFEVCRNARRFSVSAAPMELPDRISGGLLRISPNQAKGLVNIAIANAVEQSARLPYEYWESSLEQLRGVRALALPGARSALDRSGWVV